MANTIININTIDEGGGGAGSPPFSSSFVVASWGIDGSDYRVLVPSSIHGLGKELNVQVFEKVGTDFELVDIYTKIDSVTGDVQIRVSQIPDIRFEGKITIIGE